MPATPAPPRVLTGCFFEKTARLMFGANPDDVLLQNPPASYHDIESRPLTDPNTPTALALR